MHTCAKFRGTLPSVPITQSKLRSFILVVAALAFSVSPAVGNAQAAAGYSVSSFATGFGTSGAIGPIGLAFDASGNLYVGDYATGLLYKFGHGGGVASASTQLNTSPIGGAIAGMAFTKDGSLYLARQSAGDVVQIDTSTGAILRTVAAGVSGATALATDPISGDLFVSQPFVGYVSRISGFANGPGTITKYATTGFVDGLSFGPDGTLYAALSGTIGVITGTNSSSPGTVTTLSVSVPTIDGLAISANPSSLFMYGNRNDGIITKVDATVTPPVLSNIFTGGTRGDFVAVGPDGCLYATQTDRVLKVTNSDGTCLAPPLGPLFPSSPSSAFTFSAFCAGLEDIEKHKEGFKLHAKFRLASGSDGINLSSESLILKVDTISITIPAGSFKQRKSGAWHFEGDIDSMHIEARLVPIGKNAFMLMAEIGGADLNPADKPFTVMLTIGNDSGTTVAWEDDDDRSHDEDGDN